MKLGLHVSISGTLTKAFEEGKKSSSEALQIFSSSPRTWRTSRITEDAAQEFRSSRGDFAPLVVHASYLINLGSKNEEVREKSIKALQSEVERAETLGADYLVLHPGGGDENAVTYIGEGLSKVLDSAKSVKILLENVAGEGQKLGKDFAELLSIIKVTENGKKLGVCFDTCHAFGAGYDLRQKEVWEKIHDEINDTVGFEAVKLLHLNDTRGELGSNLDRHSNWGEGKLGVETLRIIAKDSFFNTLPGILETPGDLEKRTEDLKLCRELFNLER
ncbi:MAG: deoxyribonuclease IV [Bacillota bacterium]